MKRKKKYIYRKRKYRKIRNNINVYFKIIVVIVLTVFLIDKYYSSKKNEFPFYKIAEFSINDKAIYHIKNYCDINNKEFIKYLTDYIIYKDFKVLSYEPKEINQYLKNYKWKKYNVHVKYNASTLEKLYEQALMDVKCFPVKADQSSNEQQYKFEDSWRAERTYGGKRPHLGTDIMDIKNERGRLLIVSMTDGIIQNIGWNEKGGWRIGISTPKGAYFYYAHLDRYAKGLKTNIKVKAGDLLGYMGDSGYGKVPDTKGKFPVHLHIGIILNGFTKNEFWINPYWILKYSER